MKKEETKKNVTVGGVDFSQPGRDIVWPIFLIFVGVILLLNTMSIIDWSVWSYILRFWPTLLILGGLRIVFGHTKVGEIIIGIMAFLLFTIIAISSYIVDTSREERLWFIPANIVSTIREGYGNAFDRPGEYMEEELSVSDAEDITEVTLSMETAASTVDITDDKEEENVVSLGAKYYENYGVPTLEEEVDDGKLGILFDTEFNARWFRFAGDSPSYDFVLGDLEYPTSIGLDFGAGEGTISLDEIDLSSLTVNLGAGNLDIELGEDTISSTSVSFDIGAGEITLTIPKDIPFVLSYTVGVGEIDLNDEAIVSFAGNGVYESSNYEDGEEALEIDVNVGAGAFHIVSK